MKFPVLVGDDQFGYTKIYLGYDSRTNYIHCGATYRKNVSTMAGDDKICLSLAVQSWVQG